MINDLRQWQEAGMQVYGSAPITRLYSTEAAALAAKESK